MLPVGTDSVAGPGIVFAFAAQGDVHAEMLAAIGRAAGESIDEAFALFQIKLAGAAKKNWVFSLTEGMRCRFSRLRLGPEPFPEFVLIRGRRMWKLNQHASAMRQCRRDWPAQLLPWFIARLALHEHSSVKKDGKYSPNQSRMVG